MTRQATDLLRTLIATPSVSRDENAAADVVEAFLRDHGVRTRRYANNIVALPERFVPGLPVLMLNSHIDTVRPAPSYSFDPFVPFEENGRLYGLGSNDAGASVVSLIAAFLRLRGENLPLNLLLALSAEEEVGGENGMRLLLPSLAADGIVPDMAIVGEPTGMQPAIAERGLVVLDCVTRGITGHAARPEGVNAIYRAIDDISLLRGFRFGKESETLGPVRISVTMIEAGRQHNVVPDECRWVADIRTTDAYSNEETVRILQEAVSCHSVLTPRSTRIRASVIDPGHPLVRAASEMGLTPFISPTTSDMSLMHGIPSLKIGPGDSARSHSADEFILIDEIEQAISLYPKLIRKCSNETLGQGF